MKLVVEKIEDLKVYKLLELTSIVCRYRSWLSFRGLFFFGVCWNAAPLTLCGPLLSGLPISSHAYPPLRPGFANVPLLKAYQTVLRGQFWYKKDIDNNVFFSLWPRNLKGQFSLIRHNFASPYVQFDYRSITVHTTILRFIF
jgi:hypothetical protein